MDAINLAGLYELPLLDWSQIETQLNDGIPQTPESGGPNRHTCWLSTINADGSPHVTGLGASWVDGSFWFQTGGRTRKGRNLARDPRCALSVAVARMAALWAAEGWPARVDESGEALSADYSAPSAGPPPWFVYRLKVQTATAVATTLPGGATRWRF